MNNIVERLVAWPATGNGDGLDAAVVSEIMKDAADEIGQLRILISAFREENSRLVQALEAIILLKPEDMYHGSENSTAAAIAKEAFRDHQQTATTEKK